MSSHWLEHQLDTLGVTGSNPVAPICLKSFAERFLAYLPAVGSAARGSQDFGNFPETLATRRTAWHVRHASPSTAVTPPARPASPSTARTTCSGRTTPPRARRPTAASSPSGPPVRGPLP